MNISIYINTKRMNLNDSAAMAEYTKRLRAYCNPELSLRPISESKFTAFYNKLKISDHTQCYCIKAGTASLTSEAFAESIQTLASQGISHLIFFLGYDIPETLSDITPMCLSSMTLSPDLQGVVLCEQLYRSFRILNHHPYHK